MFRRTEESKLTSWFFEIDRRLLYVVLLMIAIGMFFAVSAGSVAAERINQPWYFFVAKALPFYFIGIITLFVASLLNKKYVLWISIAVVAIGFALLGVTVISPHVIKGSARFVALGPVNVLPSDIMKPGFVIITAWFLARMKEKFGDNIFLNRDAWKFSWSSWWPYVGVFCIVLGIMFKQPDIGTSMLYFLVLGIMLYVSGLPKRIMAILGGILIAGGTVAFFLWHHVHERVMEFFEPLDPLSQVGFAVNAIRQGGLFGMGDEAFAAENLPMAENDFVFAALVEDFGAIAGCLLLVLFMMVIKRLMTAAQSARDKFVLYVITGTTALFSVQVCLNLATTLHVMPPKGMTLPFISFGGSSFLGFCLLFGLTLALIREDKWK